MNPALSTFLKYVFANYGMNQQTDLRASGQKMTTQIQSLKEMIK